MLTQVQEQLCSAEYFMEELTSAFEEYGTLYLEDDSNCLRAHVHDVRQRAQYRQVLETHLGIELDQYVQRIRVDLDPDKVHLLREIRSALSNWGFQGEIDLDTKEHCLNCVGVFRGTEFELRGVIDTILISHVSETPPHVGFVCLSFHLFCVVRFAVFE